MTHKYSFLCATLGLLAVIVGACSSHPEKSINFDCAYSVEFENSVERLSFLHGNAAAISLGVFRKKLLIVSDPNDRTLLFLAKQRPCEGLQLARLKLTAESSFDVQRVPITERIASIAQAGALDGNRPEKEKRECVVKVGRLDGIPTAFFYNVTSVGLRGVTTFAISGEGQSLGEIIVATDDPCEAARALILESYRVTNGVDVEPVLKTCRLASIDDC
jgi:hypothetical protein